MGCRTEDDVSSAKLALGDNYDPDCESEPTCTDYAMCLASEDDGDDPAAYLVDLALNQNYGSGQIDIEDRLVAAGISPTDRAETVPLEAFCALARSFE